MAALSVKRSIRSEEKQGQRGPGFRKFNKSLLENEEFVLKMIVYDYKRQAEIQRRYRR